MMRFSGIRNIYSSVESTVVVSTGPTVTSDDPEERKLARKLRIEQRLKAQKALKRTSDSESSNKSNEDIEKDEYSTQLLKSADIIEKHNYQANNDVTEHRIKNNKQQHVRLIAQKEKERKILAEVESSAKRDDIRFKKITSKWTDIQKSNDPICVYAQIEDQKKKFKDLLKARDEVIIMLKNEVLLASDEYNKKTVQLNKNMEDLSCIMDNHIENIRKIYRSQINIIRKTLRKRTDGVYTDYDSNWENFFKKISAKVEQLSNKKIEAKELIAKRCDTDILTFQEFYRDIKTKYQTQVDVARQDLCNVKYMIDRHYAALEYDNGILELRSNENTLRKAMYQRKIVNLQHELTDLKLEIKKYKEYYKTENKKYKQKINQIKTKILLNEAKSRRILDINEKKFIDLWKICSDEIYEYLNKIAGFNKTFYEQYMGIRYKIPELRNCLKLSNMTGYLEAHEIMAKLNPESFIIDPKTKKRIKNSKNLHSEEDELNKILQLLPPYKSLVKHILVVLSDKAGFLTESRLKRVITNYENDERSLVKLDNIFFYLNVNKAEDIDILVKFFRPYCFCMICNGAGGNSLIPTPGSMISQRSASISYSIAETESESVNNLQYLIDAMASIRPSSTALEEVLLEVASSESQTQIIIEPDTVEIDDIEMMVKMIDESGNSRLSQSKIFKKLKPAFNCIYNHSLVIESAYALEALKTFVAGFLLLPDRVPTMNERLLSRKYSIIRLLEDNEIKQFWTNIGQMYDIDKMKLWLRLEEGINKYYAILIDRKRVAEEVVELRNRNKKLKEIILKYKMEFRRIQPVCLTFKQQFVYQDDDKALCMD